MHRSLIVDTDNQLMAVQQGRDYSIRKPCSDSKVFRHVQHDAHYICSHIINTTIQQARKSRTMVSA